YHAEVVVSLMQIIMTSILNEEDDILMPLLTILFAYMRKEKQEVSPAVETLAQGIINQCKENLRPFLTDEELTDHVVHVQQKTVQEEDPLDEKEQECEGTEKSNAKKYSSIHLGKLKAQVVIMKAFKKGNYMITYDMVRGMSLSVLVQQGLIS
ncbi:hypothetical protein KI387_037393, partial [Taxus chinensis]